MAIGSKGNHYPWSVITLAGIETTHMIRKSQFGQTGLSPFSQFSALAT